LTAFADTSGIYALLLKTEERHLEAFKAFQALLKGRRTLVTTSYVLVETAALLQHRVGLAAVRDLEERLAPLLAVEWVSGALHRKGVERLFRENRRQLSLVDCVSLEFLDAAGLRDVFALDPHFEEAGYRLLPRRR
jgi:predicted nucleic acid-binding protein